MMCVVVTVDDSPAAGAAIRLAAAEAGYRGRPLVAVTACGGEGGSGAPAAGPRRSCEPQQKNRQQP